MLIEYDARKAVNFALFLNVQAPVCAEWLIAKNDLKFVGNKNLSAIPPTTLNITHNLLQTISLIKFDLPLIHFMHSRKLTRHIVRIAHRSRVHIVATIQVSWACVHVHSISLRVSLSLLGTGSWEQLYSFYIYFTLTALLNCDSGKFSSIGNPSSWYVST